MKKISLFPKISKAIIKASNEIISGKFDDNFPLKFGRQDQELKQI